MPRSATLSSSWILAALGPDSSFVVYARALVPLDLRTDHPEVAAEPVEQRGELRVVVRAGRGEQQGVRPRAPYELGPVLDPAAGPLEDLRPGSVAVEPFLAVTARVAVQPFGLDAGGAELEAVRPADLVDDDVDLEEGGFAPALGVQGEDLARDAVVRGPARVGVEDRVAHVRHRGQHVRLTGGVGSENADQREYGDGPAARETPPDSPTHPVRRRARQRTAPARLAGTVRSRRGTAAAHCPPLRAQSNGRI